MTAGAALVPTAAAAATAERRPAIPGEEPITFPDAPRAELDDTLGRLVEQARRVLETQGRLRALVRANRAVVSHLDLPVVLRTIVEAAVEPLRDVGGCGLVRLVRVARMRVAHVREHLGSRK